MINFYPSIADGLVKRPPTRFITKMLDEVPDDAVIHIINRDKDNQCILLLMNGDVKLFDLLGNEIPISGKRPTWLGWREDNDKYTNIDDWKPLFQYPATMRNPFTAFTIADYTFILDKSKVVKALNMGFSVTTYLASRGALVNVKQASYDTTYTVDVSFMDYTNDTERTCTVSITTPKNYGTSSSPPPTVSTTEIAEKLAERLAPLGEPVLFDVVAKKSTLFVFGGMVSNLKVTTSDSRGNTHIFAINDKVQRFSSLPNAALHGFTVEITGDEYSSFDNYYVKFVANKGREIDMGTWEETCRPGQAYGPAPFDMPLVLVRDAETGSYALDAPLWKWREYGDEDSAPHPEFIGRTIQDMFLYRNRLGFLSDDTVTLSAASDFFRFYPETATTIVASDPIHLASSYESVTALKHAIPFQEDLLIFADQAQFVLESSDVLSGETAALKVATTFDANMRVKPANSGRTVFFATPGSQYGGIMEYYLDADNGTKNAANITAHVPQFLPAKIRSMVTSASADILMVLPEEDKHNLYIYKYYWSGGEKLQASWSILNFPDSEIMDIAFLESKLYLFIKRDGGLYIEYIDFSSTQIDALNNPEGRFIPHLDHLATVPQGVYDPATDETRWTLPYCRSNQDIILVDKETLTVLSTTQETEAEVSAEGDHSGKAYYCGVQYPARYVFSPQFLRRDDGGGRISTQQGRLQYRRWSIIHGKSGYFEAVVEHSDGTRYIYPLSGMVLGLHENTLDKVTLTEGAFNFPVKSKSDRVSIAIHNDTYLPCSILSAEWEAFYTTRVRRV